MHKNCKQKYYIDERYGFFSFLFFPPNFSSGDTDAVLPVTSTRYSIDALKLPTITPWHAWYDDDGEVGPSSLQLMGLQ
jgi:hypothetical protein